MRHFHPRTMQLDTRRIEFRSRTRQPRMRSIQLQSRRIHLRKKRRIQLQRRRIHLRESLSDERSTYEIEEISSRDEGFASRCEGFSSADERTTCKTARDSSRLERFTLLKNKAVRQRRRPIPSTHVRPNTHPSPEKTQISSTARQQAHRPPGKRRRSRHRHSRRDDCRRSLRRRARPAFPRPRQDTISHQPRRRYPPLAEGLRSISRRSRHRSPTPAPSGPMSPVAAQSFTASQTMKTAMRLPPLQPSATSKPAQKKNTRRATRRGSTPITLASRSAPAARSRRPAPPFTPCCARPTTPAIPSPRKTRSPASAPRKSYNSTTRERLRAERGLQELNVITDLGSYGGVQTTQSGAQTDAKQSLQEFEDECDQISRRRRKVQLAVDAERPFSNPSNGPLRTRLGLPADRGMA